MEKLMFVLELIGVAAFAVSGAMTAMEKKADMFGVVFLAVTTALGGGIIRDVLLGELPPKMFTSYTYVLVAVIASVVVFSDASIRIEKYRNNADKLDAVNNIFDAVGLAVFTVSGMNMAITANGIENPFLIVAMGMVTGIGGGMLRDMMLGAMVKVMRKRIYAVASLAGGVIYYMLLRLGIGDVASAIIGMLLVFALRVLATVFKWNLPTVEV